MQEYLIIEKRYTNFYILNNTITNMARAYCMDLQKAITIYLTRERLTDKALQIITI